MSAGVHYCTRPVPHNPHPKPLYLLVPTSATSIWHKPVNPCHPPQPPALFCPAHFNCKATPTRPTTPAPVENYVLRVHRESDLTITRIFICKILPGKIMRISCHLFLQVGVNIHRHVVCLVIIFKHVKTFHYIMWCGWVPFSLWCSVQKGCYASNAISPLKNTCGLFYYLIIVYLFGFSFIVYCVPRFTNGPFPRLAPALAASCQ